MNCEKSNDSGHIPAGAWQSESSLLVGKKVVCEEGGLTVGLKEQLVLPSEEKLLVQEQASVVPVCYNPLGFKKLSYLF